MIEVNRSKKKKERKKKSRKGIHFWWIPLSPSKWSFLRSHQLANSSRLYKKVENLNINGDSLAFYHYVVGRGSNESLKVLFFIRGVNKILMLASYSSLTRKNMNSSRAQVIGRDEFKLSNIWLQQLMSRIELFTFFIYLNYVIVLNIPLA